MKEKIEIAISYGIIGFVMVFLLYPFVDLLAIKIFPYFLKDERIVAEVCFNTPKNYLTHRELIRCSDIKFRQNLFSAGLTGAIISAIYGLLKKPK